MNGWQLVETALGAFWTANDQQRAELEQVVSEQDEHSPHYYADGDCRVHIGNVVLDLGAHLGVFTRMALDAGASRVIALDPDPTTAESFARTFATEIADGRVVFHQVVAWWSDGEMPVQGSGIMCHVASVHGTEVRTKCRARRIDSLGVDRVDFIKLDVEGAERFALMGARTVIARDKPSIACCIYHREDDPAAILEVVRSIRQDYTVTAGSVPPWMTTPELYFFWR